VATQILVAFFSRRNSFFAGETALSDFQAHAVTTLCPQSREFACGRQETR
jgi:hypothetical protein